MNYNRNAFVMSFIRKFTIPVEGVDKDFHRLYDISIPAGANWEEIFGVLTEAIADIKKMQDEEIAAKEKAALEKKEAEVQKVEDTSVEIAN